MPLIRDRIVLTGFSVSPLRRHATSELAGVLFPKLGVPGVWLASRLHIKEAWNPRWLNHLLFHYWPINTNFAIFAFISLSAIMSGPTVEELLQRNK